jgi:hypothetical protein
VLLARFDSLGDTVGLGERDLAYVVPATEGTLRLGNAVEVARAAAIGLTRPRRVGGTIVDLLAAALRGDPPGDFCAGGGTYGFEPPPTYPLASGPFALTVSACDVPEPDGSSVLDGVATVVVGGVAGDPGGSEYWLSATVAGLSVSARYLPGAITSTYGGALRFERTASSAGRTEVARSVELPAETFVHDEPGGASRRTEVGPFTVTGVVDAAGALACGAATDALTVDLVDLGLGPLEVTVLAPLAFAAANADPSAGAFHVAAPDGSTLTATVTGPGLVEIAVDTDGDGAADGALSTGWEELD